MNKNMSLKIKYELKTDSNNEKEGSVIIGEEDLYRAIRIIEENGTYCGTIIEDNGDSIDFYSF